MPRSILSPKLSWQRRHSVAGERGTDFISPDFAMISTYHHVSGRIQRDFANVRWVGSPSRSTNGMPASPTTVVTAIDLTIAAATVGRSSMYPGMTQRVVWHGSNARPASLLLSEAEREYVTRAGTTTPFWWGPSISAEQEPSLQGR
jgi:hypothetical protein